MRSLFAAGHSHGGHEYGAEEADHLIDEGATEKTLDLRVAAIFVILFGASLFGLLTLRLKSPDAIFPRLMRAFSGGIIIALALVHIIPEAVGELNSLMEFPIGGCTILFGIIVLVVIDNSLAAYLVPDSYKQHILASEGEHSAPHHHHHHHSKDDDTSSAKAHSHQHKGDSKSSSVDCEAAVQVPIHDKSVDVVHAHYHGQQNDAAADAQHAVITAAQPHGHQCLRSLNASGWVTSAAAPMKNIRQCVTAYTMELGCIFHSVIIGVGVGVITNDRQLVTTLMIALAIHQGLEALALGSVLALTSFSVIKRVAMLLLYSLTTPIGIAVGIAISSSYDPENVTSRAVQGTLNGVSGGMLLYIGMYQLIAEEFSREDLLVRPKLRLGMYAALLLGAAAMCILGIWS